MSGTIKQKEGYVALCEPDEQSADGSIFIMCRLFSMTFIIEGIAVPIANLKYLSFIVGDTNPG